METQSLDNRKYRLRWWTLLVIACSVLIVILDSSILNVALPTLQREMGAGAAQLQWMVNAYLLIFSGLMLTTGSLGDRFGRARLLRIGLVIFGLASIGAALVNTAPQLIAMRVLMGLGGAIMLPATLSILVDAFEGEERSKAIALWAAFNGIGIAIGPIIGGAILEYLSWGWIFMINAPIALVALVGSYIVVSESRDPNVRPVDIPGAILSMITISALVYGFIEGPKNGWGTVATAVSLTLALLAGIAFAVWETRTPHPLFEFSFFKRAPFSAGVAVISLGGLGMTGMLFGLTQYLQFVQSYSPMATGVRLIPMAGGLFLGAAFSDRLVHRMGTRLVVTAGMLLSAIGLCLTLTWSAGSAFWLVGLTMGLIGIGIGWSAAPATDAIMASIPKASAGIGTATNTVMRLVGGTLGIAIIGSAMYDVYASRMTDAVASLPAAAAAAAQNSVGAAMMLAGQLPQSTGAALIHSAGEAFTAALALAGVVGAVIMLVGAALAARFMPAHAAEVNAEVDLTETVPLKAR